MTLQERVDQLKWWQRIDLGDGVITPGPHDTPALLARLGLPEDLTGMTVLDVGASDGFFSFECEKRGAEEVVAFDLPQWGESGKSITRKRSFDLAHKVLKSQVIAIEGDVQSWLPEGPFDLVLCLGVLYHLKSPIKALEIMKRQTFGQLILETHVAQLHDGRPAAAVYPANELCDNATNWFGFNPPAILGLLKAAGFRDARLHHITADRDNDMHDQRAIFHALA